MSTTNVTTEIPPLYEEARASWTSQRRALVDFVVSPEGLLAPEGLATLLTCMGSRLTHQHLPSPTPLRY
ncbi:hypothetical protein Pmani_030349 [Petrolisthes manimaculis]|uniref:Uncharacterized protein n=1 Tax=Petrolisthes manimaculis TaxID=1843537 RepID=A0AAE1TTQ0_9EUCA|nr:hypothetical protein Pmani_030349 [Petrolisthes manimaculis]